MDYEQPPHDLPQEEFPAAADAGQGDDMLSQMVAEHMRWIETGGAEGRRANFSSMDLKGADFSGMMLAGANFRGADCSAVRFVGTNLQESDFSEAALVGAQCGQANLAGAQLARADMRKCSFAAADLSDANLASILGDGAQFTRAVMLRAVLRESSLRDTGFNGAELQDANFRGADLSGAILDGTNLSGADCRNVRCDKTTFRAVELAGSQWKDAALSTALIEATDFSQAHDVPISFQAESLAKEMQAVSEQRRTLAAERSTHERLRQQVKSDKEKMARLKAMFEELETDGGMVESHVAGSLRWLQVLVHGWALIVGAVLGYTLFSAWSLGLGAIEWGAFFLVLLVVGLWMMMALATAFHALGAVDIIRQYHALCHEKMQEISTVKFDSE